jgi:retron-type reverse transcriptase
LLAAVADPGNLRLAFWKARKGKDFSRQVQAYRAHLEPNLAQLRQQILSGEVRVGDYTFFKVFDPKERQICAGAFREQVLHHALMNICHPFFERAQIFDSYASRKGKGTYAALARAKTFTRKYKFFLKLDVRKFFETIFHNVLKTQLDRLIKDEAVALILFRIIDSYEVQPGRGVPIGNLTSQYFANHYLSGLDHLIKEQLRFKAYVRYMDDMVLWHDDKEALKRAYKTIRDFVETKLRLELKPPLLNFSSRGLPFLGYVLLPYDIRLSLRSRRRFVKKLRALEEKYHSGEWSEAACQRRVLPLLAFTRHANAQAFRKNLLRPQAAEEIMNIS